MVKPEINPVAAMVGIPIASTVITIFGTWWIAAGFSIFQLRAAVNITILVGCALTGLAIYNLAIGRRLLRKLSSGQSINFGKIGLGRNYAIIVAAEFFLIFAVASLFPVWRLQDYVLAAVSLIVGIHFFPLGKIFLAKRYFVLGSVIALWTLTVLVSLSFPDANFAIGVGNGTILWCAAIIGLYATTKRRNEFR